MTLTFIGKTIFGSGKNALDQHGRGNDDEETLGDDYPDRDRLFFPPTSCKRNWPGSGPWLSSPYPVQKAFVAPKLQWRNLHTLIGIYRGSNGLRRA